MACKKCSPRKGKKGTKGFTLIELLVVVSIIAILSFTVVTNLSSARAKARDSKVTQDLMQVDKAVSVYAATGGDITKIGGVTFAALVTEMKTGGLIPAKAEVNPPVVANPYAYKGAVAGAELNYWLCGKTEKPSDANKPVFVINNGASYMAADDTDCR